MVLPDASTSVVEARRRRIAAMAAAPSRATEAALSSTRSRGPGTVTGSEGSERDELDALVPQPGADLRVAEDLDFPGALRRVGAPREKLPVGVTRMAHELRGPFGERGEDR